MQSQSTNQVQEAFKKILTAYENNWSIAPLTSEHELTIEESYQVQLKFIDEKVKQGQSIVGKKIGLTSEAMQQLLGVDQPDYGHLLDTLEIKQGDSIRLSQLFQPKVEAEIAFVLKKDLQGPEITVNDVLDATDYVTPSLEIVDSRVKDWKITLADTIADNASCGLFMTGSKKVKPADVDLTGIQMQLYKNGNFINEGSGKDVLGDPAACVAWLANKLSEFGVNLKAGEIILSGALSAAVEIESGDKITASFTELGELSAKVE